MTKPLPLRRVPALDAIRFPLALAVWRGVMAGRRAAR